jgi:hypothetical protein
MAEIARVSKYGALFIADEIYSHSITDRIRHSRIVEQILYPHMQSLIYKGDRPYITADERKLNETDIAAIKRHLSQVTSNLREVL